MFGKIEIFTWGVIPTLGGIYFMFWLQSMYESQKSASEWNQMIFNLSCDMPVANLNIKF